MAEELISFTRDSEPSSTGTWQTEWPYAACMGQDGGSNSSVVWEYCRVVGVAALPPPSSSSSSSSTTEYVPSATTIGARRCLTRCHVRPKLQREGVMFVQPSRGFDVMTIADARTVPVVLSGGSSNHSLAEVVEDILRLDGSEGEQHDDEIVSRWASTLPWSSNPPFQTPSWPWHRRHQRAASSLAAGGYFAGSNPRCGHMAVVVVTARLVGKVAALGGGGRGVGPAGRGGVRATARSGAPADATVIAAGAAVIPAASANASGRQAACVVRGAAAQSQEQVAGGGGAVAAGARAGGVRRPARGGAGRGGDDEDAEHLDDSSVLFDDVVPSIVALSEQMAAGVTMDEYVLAAFASLLDAFAQTMHGSRDGVDHQDLVLSLEEQVQAVCFSSEAGNTTTTTTATTTTTTTTTLRWAFTVLGAAAAAAAPAAVAAAQCCHIRVRVITVGRKTSCFTCR